MYDLSRDTDIPLAEFVNDYIEGRLDKTERIVFEDYMSVDKELSSYIQKSARGRQVLQNTFQVKAADDFEEKLAKRIAAEKRGKTSRSDMGDLASV